MKIVHIIGNLSPEAGGPVSALYGLASAQAALGHNIHIVSTDYGFLEETVPDGIEISLCKCEAACWFWSRSMRDLLNKCMEGADIAHLHTFWNHPIWAASQISRKKGVPYVISPCGMLDKRSMSQSRLKKLVYMNIIGQRILRGAGGIHFATVGELETSLSHTVKNKSFVVPLGIKETMLKEAVNPGGFIQQFPQLSGRRIILFVGRIHYNKQPDMLIRLMPRITKHFPNTVLVLVGPNGHRYQNKLIALAHNLGIERKIFFTGMLRGEALREAYEAAELFVLPSLQENFGIVVIEAMAAGCPVVISEAVQLSPEVKQSVSGIVCKSTVEEVGGAVLELLRNDSQRKAMGKRGKKLVDEKYTGRKVAKSLSDIYQDIINGTHRAKAWNVGHKKI